MSDVFISYSRKDIAFARVLHDALKARNLSTWIDWQDIPPSADWLAEVYRAIEAADAFVFLVSQTSVNSEICTLEITHAIKNHKRVVPIVLHDIDSKMAPSTISSLNWIFFRQQDNFQQSFEKLLQAVQTDLEWVRAHTRLLVRAKEWDNKKRNDSLVLRGSDLREAEEWLVLSATGKEPKPTPLQSKYIRASRESATRRARAILVAVTFALVVALALAVVAVFQSNQATIQKNNAVSSQATAVAEAQVRATAEVKAVNEANVRATSEIKAVNEASVRATAEANAINQARISDSRALATQSAFNREQDFSLALLLGVEAVRLDNNLETRGNLLDSVVSKPQLANILYGHSGLMSVAFSPDGKTLASGSSDKTIILWDMTTHRQSGQPLIGHKGSVSCVAFSPDGRILASGSDDKTIILWDIATHQQIGQPLIGHLAAVHNIAFSPDGKTLASSSPDNTIILWDISAALKDSVTSQQIVQPVPNGAGRNPDISANIAFSPDGKTLASSGLWQRVFLWDVATRQPIGQWLWQGEWVHSLVFGPNGKTLFALDGSDIILWDIATRRQIAKSPTGHTVSATKIALSPDGKTIASGSYDQTIILWDTATGKPIGKPLTGHTGSIDGIAFSPDGKTLASGSSDKTIILWDISTVLNSSSAARQRIGQPLTGHNGSVDGVAFSPDGKTLASVSGYDDKIILWDVATRQQISQPLNGCGRGIAFSPDGKALALGCADKAMFLWDVTTQQPMGQPLGMSYGMPSVAFSLDGKALAASSGWGKSIVLWDVATRQGVILWDGSTRLPLDTGHTLYVSSLAFSPDGKTLASGSLDKTIILWDVATRQQIGQPLKGHTDQVESIAFSPDGKIIASGSSDNTIILWDVSTRQQIGQPLKGQAMALGMDSVAFSPDGKTLASANGGTILWDVATRQQIGQPLTGGCYADSVAFSPDGKTLAAGWFRKNCSPVGHGYRIMENACMLYRQSQSDD